MSVLSSVKRIYHPYTKWECYKNGMWRKESNEYEDTIFNDIISFTSNHVIYGNSMMKVVKLWKYSCDNFLSNNSINKLAYIGHAGCCLEKRYPEYLVRKAWKQLTNEQRILANKEAEKAVKTWTQKKELETTLMIGKLNVIKKEYQMKLLLS